MKSHLIKSAGLFLFLVTLFYQTGTSQNKSYVLDDGSAALVVIQLNPSINAKDSLAAATAVKGVVDQVKAINSKKTFDQVDRKIATMTLETGGQPTTYLAVRSFTDFKTAEAYSKYLVNELKSDVYGDMKTPFPINVTNYKNAITEKDFESYFKFYSKGGK